MNKILKLLFIVYFSGTYAQSLTTEDKIFGLSKLWCEVKYNFIFYEKLNFDWDSLYQNYIPKITEAKSTREYYDLLKEMCSKLGDGHTWIGYPPNIASEISVPAIKTKYIDGKIVVTKIFNDTLKRNLNVGDIILKVNGVNSINYGEKNIMPYVSASTYQDKIRKTYSIQFLSGNKKDSISIEVQKSSGVIVNLKIPRIQNYIDKKKYEYKLIEDSIGYLKINSFEVNNYKNIFDSIYGYILKSKALIIDIRENGGGQSFQADYVLSHLISNPTLTPSFTTRQNIPALKSWDFPSSYMTFNGDIIKPIEKKVIYSKPIILLISENTYSSAENFCVSFDNIKRGIKIGTITAGSSGNAIQFNLPQGGMLRVGTKNNFYPNGKQFMGIGIPPDIEIKETINSIREGKDLVLEKAISVFKQKK